MKKKKIVCTILAGLIAVTAIAGSIFYALDNQNRKFFRQIDLPANSDNYVKIKEGVYVANEPSDIQKNYKEVMFHDSQHTIIYNKELPEFFTKMQIGDVFLVYPDNSATESFFALGFCGRLAKFNESRNKSSVSFTIPELANVFSDIYISTEDTSNTSSVSANFYPSSNVTEIQRSRLDDTLQRVECCNSNDVALLASSKKSSYGIEESFSYQFKKPVEESLLNDYVLLGEELKLKFDCDVSDDEGFSIGVSGAVVLEDPAVKMILDYHYDEDEGTVELNDYSLGFIAKQKVDLAFSAEQEIGLDDLSLDLSEKAHIIDIEDVTESEKGKIVLGTYLLGWKAALPVLQNNANKISYLSLGIAVQISVTASGRLSLDYTLKESGFVQMEVKGNGENTYLTKGYDYPNPVKESRKPTNEENLSVPCVYSESSGKANIDLVVGADIGICILGMIPVKQTNNLVELEIEKTFSEEETKDKTAEVFCNNYLLDDTVNNLILSSSSHIKMHFGARVDFGLLKYIVAEMGGSIQLFKHVWYQFPSPIGFSHSQCGFGGVFVGETYSDQELDESFRDYMHDTKQGSVFATLKDSLFNPLVNAALNDLQIDLIDISAYLGGHAENYKFNYYSSGIIYVRDLNDMVVAAIVIGENIANMSGVHTGLNSAKLEQVYSAPNQEAKIDIHIGSLARSLLGIKGIEDTSLAGMSYDSVDSDEKMNLVFCDDSLQMILITKK